MPDDGLSISSILVVVASGLIIVLHMAEFGIGLARQFRAAELDAGMASLFYGLANGVFVVIWFAVAGFLFAAAVGALSSRGLPGWLAWSALVIGLGFFIAGAIPLTFFWVLPYFLFYAWVVAVSVVLLRSPTRP